MAGDDGRGSWGEVAQQIHAEILGEGVTKHGVLRQRYETDTLDASTLLAAIFGILPSLGSAPAGDVLAIADEFTEDGSSCVTTPKRPTTACAARREAS